MRIFALCVLILAVAITASATNSLVAYWPENGNSNDAVGGHNPSATNAVSFVNGKIGQGLVLGAGGFIDIPDNANLENQQFSLSVWVRPDGPGPNANTDEFGDCIVQKGLLPPAGNFNASESLCWSAVNQRFRFTIGNYGTNAIASTHTFAPGQFYHVTGTYDGSQLKLYVNGTLEAQKALTLTIPYDITVPWTIGSTYSYLRGLGFARTFNGIIDEVKLYNYALTVDEIYNNYLGLIAWWPENGNTNDIIGGHNASATNALTFVSGAVGQGVKIGSGGYIEIPDSPIMQNQKFTVSFWARPDGAGPNNDTFGSSIFKKELPPPLGNNNLSLGTWWSAADNRFRLSIGSVDANAIASSNTYPVGQFYHVVGTYDGVRLKLYVNGQLQADAPRSIIIPYDLTVPWTIGSTHSYYRSIGFARTFNGVIDEVKLYNIALSQDQVMAEEGNAPVCGNNVCEATENSNNCSADCGPPPPVCGNNTCESGESSIFCPADCGAPTSTCTAVLDQNLTPCGMTLAGCGTGDESLTPNKLNAQTYTAAITGGLTKVRLPLSNHFNGNELTLKIRNTISGTIPGTSVFGSTTTSGNLLGGSPMWVTFYFDPPVAQVAGTKYALVLYATNPTRWWADLNFYAGGNYSHTSDGEAVWNVQGAFDFGFETYVCSSDTDQDGVAEQSDNCPTVANPDQTDTDGDGQGDACDSDIDNDGIANGTDNCPLIVNQDQVDSDFDGAGNVCDSDDDNDGVEDADDNCPFYANSAQTDNDHDGLGDACDSDDDNDGIEDSSDNCVFDSNADQNDLDNDGIGDACENDTDGDGIDNSTDNCLVVVNADQLNTDGDAFGNSCDADDDNDGLEDAYDNCSLTVNADQLDNDSDGQGDACDEDDDDDSIADNLDNCPLVENLSQTNTDGDLLGNACDPDDDNDNVLDANDNCPFTANSDQADSDADGEGNVCDNDIDGDTVANANDNCPLIPNSNQIDIDADQVGDACDNDIDGDGKQNGSDSCPASDPQPQVIVGSCNSGVINYLTVTGCKITDLIGQCATGATNHGNFVSCVSQLLNTLKNQGVITGQQKGAIQSCAAQANIP